MLRLTINAYQRPELHPGAALSTTELHVGGSRTNSSATVLTAGNEESFFHGILRFFRLVVQPAACRSGVIGYLAVKSLPALTTPHWPRTAPHQ